MSPSIRPILRRIYDSFPVLRELRTIARASDELGRIARLHRAGFVARLLEADRYRDPARLNRHEFQVYSQGGEDGILAEIFRRIGTSGHPSEGCPAPVPGNPDVVMQPRPPGVFVEIGVGDGLESNTTFLLAQGWSGWWIEGSGAAATAARLHFARPIAEGRLGITQAFLTAENAASVLYGTGALVSPGIDLFSLDIDRNTYWIWEALVSGVPGFRPRVVVVEYNAAYPPPINWVVKYRPDRGWNRTSYFGASLTAYELLGRRAGYRLVACNLAGINAFFVQEDLCGEAFPAPGDAAWHHEPPRYFLIGLDGYPPCFED